MSAPAPLLLLFDIDGTLLLRAFPAHLDSLHAAIRTVYGVDVPDGHVEAAGRTDGAIARTILMLAGVAAERIDERADAFRAACCDEYARRCPPDLTDRVAPGVINLLQALAARDDVRVSLVTGNYETIARLKLARAGLGHFFERGQGGFGSDSEDRAALPPIARMRAGVAHNPWPRERTVVIGDTPRDVACARADGVHCIGIATGPFPPEELDGADAIVNHADEVLAAIEALA